MFKPQYKLTNKILSCLFSIAEAKTIIERAKILPTQELKLKRQALIRMAHSSTAIEGNILNIQQIENLAQGKKIDAPARYIYEAKNYIKALKYIEKIVQEKKTISEKIILQIHKLVTDKTLTKEQCGCYRQGLVYVVKRIISKPDEIIYTAPNHKQVPKLVKNMVAWLNQESQKANVHPIITAGIAHRELAAIHPFSDGNGRTARALATLILYQQNYDFRKLFALEDYYNQDREKYYQAINIGQVYKKIDFTKWLEYFIEGFKQEISQVKEQVLTLEISKIGKKLEKQIYLNEKQIKIIDFINTVGKITVQDAIEILNSPRRTAQLELQKLKKLNIIKQIGRGPSSAYILF